MTSNGDVVGTPISKTLAIDHTSSTDFVHVLRASLLVVWKRLTRYRPSVLARGVPRRLRVAETVSFGEKRFVSILQVDGEQFLVGGSPSNVVLLAKLEGKPKAVGEGLFENVFLRVDSNAIERQAGRNGSIEVTQ
jgi:flagellar biogenesis protein FliO